MVPFKGVMIINSRAIEFEVLALLGLSTDI